MSDTTECPGCSLCCPGCAADRIGLDAPHVCGGAARAERRQRLEIMGARFFRCPNTGVILMSLADHDDKIMCGCGRPNPAIAATESGRDYRGVYHIFTGAHLKRAMAPADIEAYLDQGPEGAAFRRRRS
jgi:hypothetical protein